MTHAWRRLPVRARLTLWYTTALLVILALIGLLSHRVLAWSLSEDLDASLAAVAQVLSATTPAGPSPEDVLRHLLGPEIYDKFFQFLDPFGRPTDGPGSPRDRGLPLSAQTLSRVVRGERAFETLTLERGERVRLLTVPVFERGRVTRLVRVGMPLARLEQTLRSYRNILLALVPLGLGLAALGGASAARRAFRPVDEMSRAARRITAEALSERLALQGSGDELDHLAGTLNGMLARLETAFAEVRRFTADAAHELRTPLTVLKGSIEVALRAERSPEEYRAVLRTSLEEADRLVRIAEDLLALSRSAAGSGLRRDRVDLEALVLDVLDAGARLARGTGVSVRLGEAEPVVTTADAAALRRAVLNLVENGVKYTPAGGSVTLSLRRESAAAVIAVEDTGPGIPGTDRERIFEPFVRLDEARSRDTGGTGLGLAIARSIVTAHGGTLGVEGPAGGGSRFVMRLAVA